MLTATKVLELDPYFRAKVLAAAPETNAAIVGIVTDLQEIHGWSADQVASMRWPTRFGTRSESSADPRSGGGSALTACCFILSQEAP